MSSEHGERRQTIRFRGVIFDLFHTLTAQRAHWSSYPATSVLLGVDRRDWTHVLFNESRWRLAGEERDPAAIVSRLADAVGVELTPEKLARAVEVRTRRFQDAILGIPDENLEVFDRLRSAGLSVGLVSNADAMEAAAWPGSPASSRMDAAVFSCDVGHVKPEPGIYLECLERLGLPAADCLYVGDGSSDELRGAKALGMTPVLMSGIIAELWPEVVEERRGVAKHEVSSIAGVERLLDRL